MKKKEQICNFIENKKNVFIDASDRIWEHAETRFDLKKSADALCDVLQQEGFTIERGCGGMQDAFIATYGSGKPVIGILAEYDALPNISQVAGSPDKKTLIENGNGHGCGHNALGAGAVAGAYGIKAYMQENNLSGTIKCFGCPAEESGSGKAFMARSGLFDNLDSIITWHPMTENAIWGASSLANYQINFEFKGVSSHAAAAPQFGRSALDAVELMSVGVNYLREHVVQEARIHYAYIDAGGTSPNVVQPTAKVLYFIRAPKSSQVKEIYERVVDVAKGAALMTGTKMEVKWDSACAEYIVNNTLGEVMYANMQSLGEIAYTDEELDFASQYTEQLGSSVKTAMFKRLKVLFPNKSEEELRIASASPLTLPLLPYSMSDAALPASTDVGDASWHAPTAQFTAVCYPAGTIIHSWQYVACGQSSILHKGMLYAAKTIAMTALDILENPKLVDSAKSEFLQRLSGENYICPIPADVLPK